MNWLSYLTPVTLFKGKTKRNTLVEVREVFGKSKMDLDGYPQSNATYHRSWKHVFVAAKLTNLDDAGKSLVLGLGGGNIADILAKLKPHWHTTLVELEPEVVMVAKKYFGITSNDHRSIVTGDARDYMKHNKQSYDLVIVDLYKGDDVPRFVTTATFLTNIRSAITNKGCAIFNYASHSFSPQDLQAFENKLGLVFNHVERKVDWGHTYYIVSL